MQRIIAGCRQFPISVNHHQGIRRFNADFKFEEIIIFQHFCLFQSAFDHGVGCRFAVFFQQAFIQRAAVNPDTNRAAVCLGRFDNFFYAVGSADVAGINPQAGSAVICRQQPETVIKMNVGHHRDINGFGYLFQSPGRSFIRTGAAGDVAADPFLTLNLFNGCLNIGCRRIGHRLNRNRGIASDGNFSYHNLTGFATNYFFHFTVLFFVFAAFSIFHK